MAVPRHARAAFFPDTLAIKNSAPLKNPPSPTLTQSTNGRIMHIVNNYAEDASETTLVPDFPSPPQNRAITPVPPPDNSKFHYSTAFTAYPDSVWSEDQRPRRDAEPNADAAVDPTSLESKLRKALALRNNPSIASRDTTRNLNDIPEEDGVDGDDAVSQRTQIRQIAHEYMLRSPPSNTLQLGTFVAPQPVLTTRPLPTQQLQQQGYQPEYPHNQAHQQGHYRDHGPQQAVTSQQQQPQRAVWFASHLSPSHQESYVPPTPPSSPARPNFAWTTAHRGTQAPSRQHTPTPYGHSGAQQQQQQPPQRSETPVAPFPEPPRFPPAATPRRLALSNFLHRNPAQPSSAPKDDEREKGSSNVAGALWTAAKGVNKVRKALSPFAMAARIAIVVLAINILIVDVLVVIFAVRIVPQVAKIEAVLRSLGAKL